MADKSTDLKYRYMRNAHNQYSGESNGYRSHKFFLREQKLVISLLMFTHEPILDIACGSGIMLSPLLKDSHPIVLGIDYNKHACADARNIYSYVVRGDAFKLGIKDSSIPQIINCQFLNQQTKKNAEKLIDEIARVLQPGGQAIIIWRNSQSLLHISSHLLLSILDIFRGAPIFPQYKHTIKELKSYSIKNGLSSTFEAVSLPLSQRKFVSSNNIFANIIGASNVIVIKKSCSN